MAGAAAERQRDPLEGLPPAPVGPDRHLEAVKPVLGPQSSVPSPQSSVLGWEARFMSLPRTEDRGLRTEDRRLTSRKRSASPWTPSFWNARQRCVQMVLSETSSRSAISLERLPASR